MPDSKKQPAKGFDEILEELQTIVSKMENGNLKLEKVISLFEKGMKLTENGEKVLEEAQLKVDNLLQKNNKSINS
ncbi:MAG: exodeoxyribonuclease VII small subunit [Myxococcota bacterium]